MSQKCTHDIETFSHHMEVIQDRGECGIAAFQTRLL
jgi:hypothetical protein